MPDRYLGILFVIPAFALLMIISIYPTIYCIYISLTDWNLLRAYAQPQFIGYQNYAALFSDEIFANSLMVTVIFTVASVLIELVLGILLGILFCTECVKWRRVSRTLVSVPIMITPVVVGFTWKSLLNLRWGIVNVLLNSIGITGMEWHTTPMQALPTMILIDVWQWTPLVTLVVIAVLSSLPPEPFEAAAIDGAGRLQIFRKLTLPMLKGGITMVALIRIIDTLREFDKIFILTRGGPGHSTDLLSVFGYRIAFVHGYVAYASAIALVLFVFVIVACSVLIKIMTR